MRTHEARVWWTGRDQYPKGFKSTTKHTCQKRGVLGDYRLCSSPKKKGSMTSPHLPRITCCRGLFLSICPGSCWASRPSHVHGLFPSFQFTSISFLIPRCTSKYDYATPIFKAYATLPSRSMILTANLIGRIMIQYLA